MLQELIDSVKNADASTPGVLGHEVTKAIAEAGHNLKDCISAVQGPLKVLGSLTVVQALFRAW